MRKRLSLLLALALAVSLVSGCAGSSAQAEVDGSPSSSHSVSQPAEEAPSSASSQEEPDPLLEWDGQTLRLPSLGLSLPLEGNWALLSSQMLGQMEEDAPGALGDERLEPEEGAPSLAQNGAMAVEADRSWTLTFVPSPAGDASPLEVCRENASELAEILEILEEPQAITIAGCDAAFFVGRYTQPEGGVTLYQGTYAVDLGDQLLLVAASSPDQEGWEQLHQSLTAMSREE